MNYNIVIMSKIIFKKKHNYSYNSTSFTFVVTVTTNNENLEDLRNRVLQMGSLFDLEVNRTQVQTDTLQNRSCTECLDEYEWMAWMNDMDGWHGWMDGMDGWHGPHTVTAPINRSFHASNRFLWPPQQSDDTLRLLLSPRNTGVNV